jgi:hypothetical protein
LKTETIELAKYKISWLAGSLYSVLQHRAVWKNFTDVSEVFNAFTLRTMATLIMEAAGTSETFVNFYQTTRRYNTEGSRVHTRRHENIKSYTV